VSFRLERELECRRAKTSRRTCTVGLVGNGLGHSRDKICQYNKMSIQLTRSILHVCLIRHPCLSFPRHRICRRPPILLCPLSQGRHPQWSRRSLFIFQFRGLSLSPENLVHQLTIDAVGSFVDDLAMLQDNNVLSETLAAYILARLDPPSTGWTVFSYVPDHAKVRDKVPQYFLPSIS